MKKLLSLFLSMVMIITSVIVPTTISASAAEDVFTDKVDEITITDLKFAANSGNRQNTTYESTSPTYSVKFKYLVVPTADMSYQLTFDHTWRHPFGVWFQKDATYFCYQNEDNNGNKFEAVTTTTLVEMGRLYVESGPNAGKYYVYIKMNDVLKDSFYTDLFDVENGYMANADDESVTFPSNRLYSNTGSFENGLYSDNGFTKDIDRISPHDLDYVSENSYSYDGTSKYYSVIYTFYTRLNDGDQSGFRIAFDSYWSSGFALWFKDDSSHFGWEVESSRRSEMHKTGSRLASDKYSKVEMARIRVVAGPNAGNDCV